MESAKKTCPVCRSECVSVFAEMAGMPVHCNILWHTRESALKARRGDIKLGFCSGCGHIFNTGFDPEAVKYSQEYENSLHFSPFFQDYARSLAVKLIEKFNLYGKDIIEIGCGKGDFLVLLSELGGNRGVGFDASYVHERLEHRDNKVVFIQDLYSEQYSDYKGDLICSRQVLEHIESPREFLDKMRKAIGDRSDTVVFFEVPNVLYTFRELAIWDIIYEHYSYFSAISLAELLSLAGFRAVSFEESFEGQFLCAEAFPSCGPENAVLPVPGFSLSDLKTAVAAFSRRYTGKILAWKNELERLRVKGQKAVLWGGGSKGVSFLNALGVTGQISHVIDINPHKHGKYIPGTGQEIGPPEFIREYSPDIIIVMNPNYIGEIWQMVKGMGLSCSILCA
ncbi:MAG: methyltransferase domain-containing protein [Deltaproteobacteria bacterium]|nr:methyltransferase domain-containing protein [Deltaproteobacteria bacterium]MBZ0219166.1 methyltransferase domain-containing protein [Deltaproteobacteria bacterium]